MYTEGWAPSFEEVSHDRLTDQALEDTALLNIDIAQPITSYVPEVQMQGTLWPATSAVR